MTWIFFFFKNETFIAEINFGAYLSLEKPGRFSELRTIQHGLDYTTLAFVSKFIHVLLEYLHLLIFLSSALYYSVKMAKKLHMCTQNDNVYVYKEFSILYQLVFLNKSKYLSF